MRKFYVISIFTLAIFASLFSGCEKDIYAECGYSGQSAPTSVAELIEGCPSLDSGVLKIMNGFSDGFGKSYRTEQVKLCERCIEELSALRAEISEKLPTRRKLNSTLCISGAMAVVILFI